MGKTFSCSQDLKRFFEDMQRHSHTLVEVLATGDAIARMTACCMPVLSKPNRVAVGLSNLRNRQSRAP